MEKLASLSTGAKLVLVAGGLLFFDLFLTWQTVAVDFGPKNTIMQGLDGWDIWGLLMGVAILALISLVIARQYDDGLAFDARWTRVLLALGVLVLVFALIKNLGDSDSTWASYVGVILAGVVAVGAYLDFSHQRERTAPVGPVWRTRDRTGEQASAQQTSSRDEASPRW